MGSYLKLIEEKTMMKINPANYEGMLKDFPGYLSRRFVPDLTKKFIRNHGAITYCQMQIPNKYENFQKYFRTIMKIESITCVARYIDVASGTQSIFY